MAKKWAAPSAFLAAAAIIVTLMWLYGGAGETTDKPASTTVDSTQGVTDEQSLEDQVPADDAMVEKSGNELMKWPADKSQLDVVAPFYDEKSSSEERQAAWIEAPDNTLIPNLGIDLAKGDLAFDVSAALSGVVTVSEKNPLNGNVVQIKHANGLVTIYNSLSDVQVKVGDSVKQGQLIAKAGRDELEKSLGVHLHFEVRQNGKALNPTALIEAASADSQQ
ncbi:M23 family metallopeptidase [Paenibacillus sacheonensis]|nr:stage II sporulation protein Q [Paenibacillus sacheonensis]